MKFAVGFQLYSPGDEPFSDIVADYSEAVESQKIFGRHLPEMAEVVKEIIAQNKEKMLSFPFLSKQTDTGFILWNLVKRSSWQLLSKVQRLLAEKYFADITPASRPYTQAAIASPYESGSVISSYGCDGIDARPKWLVEYSTTFY